MDDDKIDLSRRKVLGSLGAIGVGGAASGAGTYAYFNDQEEVTDNTVTAGALDLKVGWEMTYNGADTEMESQELTNNPGPIFQIPPHDDVKPGDYGEATISLHVFDNPAWVHMGGALTANDDNGLTDPEREVDDTGGEGEGELADNICARAWYDGTGDEEDGGNNVYDDGEVQITAGTLREVLDELSQGVLLDDQTTSNSGTESDQCTQGQKIDRPPNEGDVGGAFNVGPGTVTITKIYYKEEDGEKEAIGFDWTSSGVKLCKIAVKGSDDTKPNGYGCDTSGTAMAPFNENSDKISEISNFTFYYCEGDQDDGKGCFPNSTTQYIGFEWMLPKSVGNEVQSDSVEFDLKFHAQQCRHVDEPENPYAGT